MTDALVLLGRLVTFDPDRPEVEDGALYVGADERIHAAQRQRRRRDRRYVQGRRDPLRSLPRRAERRLSCAPGPTLTLVAVLLAALLAETPSNLR